MCELDSTLGTHLAQEFTEVIELAMYFTHDPYVKPEPEVMIVDPPYVKPEPEVMIVDPPHKMIEVNNITDDDETPVSSPNSQSSWVSVKEEKQYSPTAKQTWVPRSLDYVRQICRLEKYSYNEVSVALAVNATKNRLTLVELRQSFMDLKTYPLSYTSLYIFINALFDTFNPHHNHLAPRLETICLTEVSL